MTTHAEATQRIQKCRIRLLSEFPFFGSLSMHLRINLCDEDNHKDIKTAAVNSRGDLFFNLEFLGQLTDAELAGVMCHEILHIALFVWQRQAHRNKVVVQTYKLPDGTEVGKPILLFNIAHDYAINLIIKDVETTSKRGWLTLPENCCLDEKYRGMSAEEIYDKMLEDGIPEFNGPLEGDVIPGQGNAPGNEDVWKQAVMAAYNQHRKMGKEPVGAIQDLIDSWCSPKIPWQDQLSQWVGDVLGKADYTYKRPSRRAESVGEILAAQNPTGMPTVVVLWDTSGSMIDSIPDVVSEVVGILEAINAPIRIILCDCEVQGDQQLVSTIEDIKEHVKGGGGSNFVPAFEEVLKTSPSDTVIVAITDGYIGIPSREPPVQAVLWVLMPGGVDPTGGQWGHPLFLDKVGD